MGQTESKENEHNQNRDLRHGSRPASHGGETRTRRPTPPIAGTEVRELRTPRTPATPSKPGQRLHGNAPGTLPKSAGPFTSNRPISRQSAAGPSSQPKFQTASPARPTTRRLQQQFAVRPQSKTPQAVRQNVSASSRPRSLPIPINRRPRGRQPVQQAAPPTKTNAFSAENDIETAGPPAKRVTRSRSAKLNDEVMPPSGQTTSAETKTSKNNDINQPHSEDGVPESPDPFELPSMGDQSLGCDSDEKMSGDSESDDSDAESDTDSIDRLDDVADDLEEPAEGLDVGDETRAEDNSKDSESDLSRLDAAAERARPSRRASVGDFAVRRSRRRSVPVRRLQVDPHRAVYVSV